MIYRALPPWRKVDPYGPAAQHQLMITNLRVRLLQRQPCPCQAKDLEAAVLPTDHYAIYDFIVKGSCLCNGHADHCVPSRGFGAGQQKTSNMVRDFFLLSCRACRCVVALWRSAGNGSVVQTRRDVVSNSGPAVGIILSPLLFV